MSLISIARGDFLQDKDSFEAYIEEDAKYFNRVVDLTGSGEKLEIGSSEAISEEKQEIIQVMVIGDAFWLGPYFYWTDNNWKGRFSRIALSLIESRFRRTWVKRAKEYGELGVQIPEYSSPQKLDINSSHNITQNNHFERLMQAFSILNLEWVLYVDSEVDRGIDRELINEMISESLHFFNTGDAKDSELLQMQATQHHYAADWLENFLTSIEESSISLERSIKGIRSYADLMEESI